MSRFRRKENEGLVREELPQFPGQSDVHATPMPANEFARRRRKRLLTLAAVVGVVVLIAGAAVYLTARPKSAQKSLTDARRFYNSGNYTEALNRLEFPLSDRSTRARAYSLRAEIHKSLALPKVAIEDVSRVISFQPDVADHYRIRAELFLETGDPSRAAADYAMLINLQGSAEAYAGRGLCYLELGQPQKAIEDFSKSIALKPSVENQLQRGLVYESLGDHRKAIADYSGAIEINPEAAQVYRARAYALQAIGDRVAAERDRERATTLESPPPLPPHASPKR